MKVLGRTQFGNSILRQKAKAVPATEIRSAKIQTLIKDMRHTLLEKKLGIGLAAPQVGTGLAIAVIAIRPTKLRPKIETFDLVLINPIITTTVGRKRQLWEGCISSGAGGKAGLFAKVPRYHTVEVTFYDESGKKQTKTFKGLQAQVIQHEVDHLNGVLFVDRVKDTSTYMTYPEYKKYVQNNK